MVGLGDRQREMIGKASGEEGIRDFRNYLAGASSVVKSEKVALLADASSRMVCAAVPLKQHVIMPDKFLEFASIFMENAKLHPTRYEGGDNLYAGLTLYMDSDEQIVRTIADGEDFLINSYYLRWSLGEVELGRYYERLVCTNGQTETIRSTSATIYSLDTGSVKSMLEIPSNTKMLQKAFDGFAAPALEAMQARASVGEVKAIASMLIEHRVDDTVIRDIAPADRYISAYEEKGFPVDRDSLRRMKTDLNVWDIYNKVTDFASNNVMWDGDDNRRGSLMLQATKFLRKERDIVNYDDIFAEYQGL